MSLLTLPNDVLAIIYGQDEHMYNSLVRLCRALSARFTLSHRLDCMIALGVTIRIHGRTHNHTPLVTWRFRGKLHTIWGPAVLYEDCADWYYKNAANRRDGPAHVSTTTLAWYKRGAPSRASPGPVRIVRYGNPDRVLYDFYAYGTYSYARDAPYDDATAALFIRECSILPAYVDEERLATLLPQRPTVADTPAIDRPTC